VLPADLSRRGEAAALADHAVEALGGIDVLVNNAGVGVGGTQWRVADRDEAREMLETNLWSPLALTGAVVPAMLERDSGAVVNVTSLSQVMPWGAMGHYSFSKAALASATETLRLELGGTGVHVVEVVAGPTDTAIQAESRLVPGFADATRRSPMGKPERLARLVVRALERGRGRVVYPRALMPFYTLPFIGRRTLPLMARRYSGSADDERVLRSGSGGDPEVLAAREEWERSRGRV
jgi:short-subunit dehydrogenase